MQCISLQMTNPKECPSLQFKINAEIVFLHFSEPKYWSVLETCFSLSIYKYVYMRDKLQNTAVSGCKLISFMIY